MSPIRSLALFLLGLTLASGQSQTTAEGPQADSHAPWVLTNAWFRKTFFYDSVHVTLREPTHLREYVVEGKLHLSLKTYLDLGFVVYEVERDYRCEPVRH